MIVFYIHHISNLIHIWHQKTLYNNMFWHLFFHITWTIWIKKPNILYLYKNLIKPIFLMFISKVKIATVKERTTTVWPPTLMITIWDHKLAQLNSSFWLSLPRAKSIRNWLRNSSATALITASAQREKRDRPYPPQIWRKQQKQHNFIKTRRFFVF